MSLARLGLFGFGQRSVQASTLHGYWKIPTTAAAGTAMHVTLVGRVTGTTYAILQQGDVTVASGYASLRARFGAPGDKCMSFMDNWDGNLNTSAMHGVSGIATYAWT